MPCDFDADLPKGFFEKRVATQAGYRLVPLAEISIALARLPVGCKVTVLLDCCLSVVPGISAKKPSTVAFDKVTMVGTVPEAHRLLMLPPLHMVPCLVMPGCLQCTCHSYAAGDRSHWCAELSIEGVVQGAFTWCFVKALLAGNTNTTVREHTLAMERLFKELRSHHAWLSQVPVVHISPASKPYDRVLI